MRPVLSQGLNCTFMYLHHKVEGRGGDFFLFEKILNPRLMKATHFIRLLLSVPHLCRTLFCPNTVSHPEPPSAQCLGRSGGRSAQCAGGQGATRSTVEYGGGPHQGLHSGEAAAPVQCAQLRHLQPPTSLRQDAACSGESGAFPPGSQHSDAWVGIISYSGVRLYAGS